MHKIRNLYSKFITSDLFIIFMFALNVLFWWLKLGTVMMIASSIILLSIILFNIDRTSIISIALANVINYRIAKLEENFTILIVFSVILLPFVIYDLVKHKIKYKNNIFISLVIFFIVNIISLVNTNSETIKLGLIGVMQIAIYAIIFLYFYTYRKKGNFLNIAKNACAMGLAISMQFAIKFAQFDGDIISKSVIDLGWGLSNYIAIVMSIIIPLTFYLYMNNQKNKFPLVCVVLFFLVVLLTFSKGSFLAWIVALIPFLICAYIFSKQRRILIIDGLCCLILLGLLILVISKVDVIWNGLVDYFEHMDSRGWFNDKGRLDIYKIGFEQFKKNPLFGAGSYTGQYYLELNINYHNFIIQTIATVGAVGLISFGYYLFTIVKSTLVNHYFNISILFIFILLTIHGLVDTTWYNPLVMVIMSIILPSLIKKEELTSIK